MRAVGKNAGKFIDSLRYSVLKGSIGLAARPCSGGFTVRDAVNFCGKKFSTTFHAL